MNELKEKVIYDCDFDFYNDDCMTLCMLLSAKNQNLVDLLGVTIVGGNTFVAEGTNSILWTLEKLGRNDIRIYQGTDVPLGGFRDNYDYQLITEKWGCIFESNNYIKPEDYHNLGEYYNKTYGYSETKSEKQSAVDYLIEMVNKYPNEITIIATGAMTNIAMAIEKDRDFSKKCKKIIYMVGSVGKGNITEFAEFNAFCDPKALKICLEADFKEQIIIPYEIHKYAQIDNYLYSELKQKNIKHTKQADFWLNRFEDLGTNDLSIPVWDEACIIAMLKPELFTDVIYARNIDVCIDETRENYGQMLIEEGNGNFSIMYKLNKNVFADFLTNLICEI